MSDVVERAKAALEGVYDGPWVQVGLGNIHVDPAGSRPPVAKTWTRGNGEFIAQARTLVPELVAELERARDLITEFRKRDESATRVIERLRSYKSLPPGMVWQDCYSPDDACKIRADYEVIDAENERLLAIVERVREECRKPAYGELPTSDRILTALEADR